MQLLKRFARETGSVSIRVSSLVSNVIVLFADLERGVTRSERPVAHASRLKRGAPRVRLIQVIKMDISCAFNVTFRGHANPKSAVKTAAVCTRDICITVTRVRPPPSRGDHLTAHRKSTTPSCFRPVRIYLCDRLGRESDSFRARRLAQNGGVQPAAFA